MESKTMDWKRRELRGVMIESPEVTQDNELDEEQNPRVNVLDDERYAGRSVKTDGGDEMLDPYAVTMHPIRRIWRNRELSCC